jgi:flagella basal body P-ring formation protein FlgA
LRHFLPTILLILACNLSAENRAQTQTDLVLSYFSEALGIAARDIELKVLHAPDLDSKLIRKGEISVQRGHRELNLGHQTLWLVHKSELPVANGQIKRLDLITPEMVSMKTQRVGREYNRLITKEDVYLGKMASQSIRAGRVLEKNMLKTAPDVRLGDDLQIILLNKGVSLALPGIAKEEALIGEEIRVQCPTTRKEFRGVLQNAQEVLVSLR